MAYYSTEEGLAGCLVAMVLVAAFTFLEAWVVQALWNWLAPLFWSAAPIITYWQSFGICVLLSIIGSFFRSSK